MLTACNRRACDAVWSISRQKPLASVAVERRSELGLSDELRANRSNDGGRASLWVGGLVRANSDWSATVRRRGVEGRHCQKTSVLNDLAFWPFDLEIIHLVIQCQHKLDPSTPLRCRVCDRQTDRQYLGRISSVEMHLVTFAVNLLLTACNK